MCVLTTKLSNGVPSRAKSRIVVLGNRDPTPWASSDCYTPVISYVHRLIISLAIAHRYNPKQGDVKMHSVKLHFHLLNTLWSVFRLAASFLANCGSFGNPCMVSVGHLATGIRRCHPPSPTFVFFLAPMYLDCSADILLPTIFLSVWLFTWTILYFSLPATLTREHLKPNSTSL